MIKKKGREIILRARLDNMMISVKMLHTSFKIVDCQLSLFLFSPAGDLQTVRITPSECDCGNLHPGE